MVTYVLLYLFCFTVPGILLASILGLGRSTLLLFLPFSYLLVVVNLGAAKLSGIQVEWFVPVGAVEIIVLAVLWLAMRKARKARGGLGIDYRDRFGVSAWNRTTVVWTSALFVAFAAYFLWVGPYTEVPSDFWTHAGKMQYNFLEIDRTGTLPGVRGWGSLAGKDAEYWYAAQALLAHAAGIDVEQLISPQAWINSMVLVIAIFALVRRIMCCAHYGSVARLVIAAVSTVLFVMHFGTSVFSFVRYYAFGPVLLNYIVYLAFVVLVLDFLGRSPHPKGVYPLLLAVLGALMAVIHLQEAMFAAVTGYALLTYFWIRRCVVGEAVPMEGVRSTGIELGARQIQWLFLAATGVLLVVWMGARVFLERHDPLAYNRLVNAKQILPFLDHVFVLDPGGQFYETVTVWGFLVLVLVLVLWRKFRHNPVLVVGALSPFYTVFNPVFTDFFLRISWPEVLWRLLYLLPLPVLGAVLIYSLGRAVVVARHSATRTVSAGLIVALIVLLFPVESTYLESPYSRVYTLKPVKEDNNYTWWDDLYQYLDTVEPGRRVLSDPITGYMLRTLTHHRYYGAKFHTIHWGGYRQLNRDRYTLDSYRQYDGWLLIVNRRNGGPSRNGAISRHWLGKQLRVEEYYEPEFLRFVDANPEHFRKRWSTNDIQVFEIVIDS